MNISCLHSIIHINKIVYVYLVSEFLHSFRFVILISGFMSLAKCHQYLYEKKITIESLHVIGQSDTCILQSKFIIFFNFMP